MSDNALVIIHKGKDFFVVRENNQSAGVLVCENYFVHLVKSVVFQEFDLKIARSVYTVLRAEDGFVASLGQALIYFHDNDFVAITRRRGAISRRKEWNRDKVRLSDLSTGKVITEIIRVKQDVFTVLGIAFSNGSLVPIQTDYTNLSILVSGRSSNFDHALAYVKTIVKMIASSSLLHKESIYK